jgi:xanthine/uracil permease
MAFDRNRSVQWKRLCIEWAVVALVVIVLMGFIDSLRTTGNLIGLIFGGVIYLAFGWLMAKLGYQRQRVRWDQTRPPAAPSAGSASSARSTPPPTKRTNAPKSRKS